LFFLFFFSSRRRHTRSKRDWSSDVCSSDLRSAARFLLPRRRGRARFLFRQTRRLEGLSSLHEPATSSAESIRRIPAHGHRKVSEIGRASCRERVEISVGAVSMKINKER